EIARERVERDVDDRRVEDRHDRPDHDDDRDRLDLRAQAPVLGHRVTPVCGTTSSAIAAPPTTAALSNAASVSASTSVSIERRPRRGTSAAAPNATSAAKPLIRKAPV